MSPTLKSSRDRSHGRSGAEPADRVPSSLAALLDERVASHGTSAALTTPLASRLGDASLTAATLWSWEAVASAALAVAARLEAEGLARGDRLAHSGPQTADWVVTDLACLLSGIVHVSLHADMPVEQRRQWCECLGVRAMIATGYSRGRLPAMPCRLLDWRSPECESLLGGQSSLARETLARKLATRVAACEPDAEAVILFSSGTTGRGRAVVHSQRSLAVNAASSAAVFLEEEADVRLAWLPLSHSLARTGDLGTALVRGACLAIVEDRMRVLDAAREASPTVILGVPAFFERVERALASGRITDLSASLGGRVRVCVSGGAPLRKRTATAFARAGVSLVEGYGLAEAGPVVSLASPRSWRAGTVGPPIAGVHVRCNEQGVLQVKSPGIALGVIEAGEQQRHAVTNDGWLSTGDLGRVDPDGHVVIAGRAVDVLTLAGGEKIPPADIEACLAEDPVIAQVCLIGDGLRRPLAVIVPEPDVLREAVHQLSLKVLSRRQALRHPRLLAWLARRVAWRQRHFPRAWQADHLLLLGRSFDPRRGEVTVSMKLRRQVIAAQFSQQTAAISAHGAQGTGLRAGVATVQTPTPSPAAATAAADCLWKAGSSAGFAAAAAAAAAAMPETIRSIQEDALAVAQRMRDDGSLFDETGRLSGDAETAIAATGLFGLVVPPEYGGSGGGMQQLCRVVSRMACVSPTTAGMLSVHSTIGAVWALREFGSPQQQQRHLPGLARGEPLSVFAATEPDAGCDLGRVTTTLKRIDGRLVVSGHKLYITGATHGRMVKLLARDAANGNRPVVLLVRLPPHDTEQLRLERCLLHPLKHAHNQAILFNQFEVDPADILKAPAKSGREPDAMQIVWHGLNRGRVTLAAQAVGTLRLMLHEAVLHARTRETWGQPIASRELIQGRIGRIAAAAVASEALANWAAHAIDSGGSGELEAITAKVAASGLVRDSAADAYGIHGGRGFLLGHPLGDALHDHFAVNTYEGESGLLELALFKGLAKRHPLASHRSRSKSAVSLVRLFADRLACRWTSNEEDRGILNHRFRLLALAARRGLIDSAGAIERSFRRYGRDLSERQLLVGNLAARVRDQITVLAVAHHADRVIAPRDDSPGLSAAETACRLALARSQGRHLNEADLSALATTGKHALTRDADKPVQETA